MKLKTMYKNRRPIKKLVEKISSEHIYRSFLTFEIVDLYLLISKLKKRKLFLSFNESKFYEDKRWSHCITKFFLD